MAKKKETPDNEYKMVSPSELIPYENNPRLNGEAVDYVANSIRELGFGAPIIVDDKMVIIAGHTRLQAAQKLGLEKVPVVIMHKITPEQAKAMRLADNKISEKSTWDLSALDIELDALKDVFDMEDFGFLDMKYEEFDDIGEEEDDDDEGTPVARTKYPVTVDFLSEEEQREFYEECLGRGYVCKIG